MAPGPSAPTSSDDWAPVGEIGTPLSLGRLVALSGVPASTVHHYRRLGLLPELGPAKAGRFAYKMDHLRALQLIRELRDERGLSLEEVRAVLPGLLDGSGAAAVRVGECAGEPQKRLIDAAFRLFSEPRGYASVSVSEIAAAAGVAKGSVYRHFPSKEALFTAVVESLCQDTAQRFAEAVADLGGRQGLAADPGKTALVFGRLIARAMPILLELGARAARGDLPSQLLAARVLRTLAEAAGRPLSENPIPAGLQVIETAFATVLQWAVGPDWVERDQPAGG
ncbi:MAG TPA: TetR family transcriptional regulator [Acidimicrobiales bacterium]|nr:TetR family transcriptional regulator [Acidimicrobiales bacterium]